MLSNVGGGEEANEKYIKNERQTASLSWLHTFLFFSMYTSILSRALWSLLQWWLGKYIDIICIHGESYMYRDDESAREARG